MLVADADVSWRTAPRARSFDEWRVWDDHGFDSPQQGMARDRELGLAVAGGTPPTFRVWVSPRSLAVSRQDARLPAFYDAAAELAANGWPVIVRETGGFAVALDPGIVNLSLVIPRSLLAGIPGPSIDLVYHLLCRPIRQTLSSLNIKTGFGSVPRAFCDGRFNLVVDGKKIAGTAQAWRAGRIGQIANGDGYVLAQAALLVDSDIHRITDVVNRFYRLAGRPAQFSATELVSVRDCLGSGMRLFVPVSNQVGRVRKMLVGQCALGNREAMGDLG